MTSNRKTVLDEDRQPSDWIELFNAGNEPVDLKGWGLTDSAKDLTKWTFTDGRLAPGEYLLVFASGKDRRIAGRELHTNFKLSADGDYLGLVQPNGKTVAMQFSPKLPRMRPDVSYGIPLSEELSRVLTADATKWVQIPQQDPGADWLRSDFNPVGWESGKGGIGFDSGTNLLRFIGSDVGARMKGKSASMLMRVPFVMTNAELDHLVMRMYFDDGFVAWLNGKEVARRNAAADANWKSAASQSRKTAAPVVWTQDFEAEDLDIALMNADATGRSRVSVSTPDTNHFLRLVNGRVADQVNGVAFPATLQAPASALHLDFEFRAKGQSTAPNDLYIAFIPTKDHGVKGIGAPLSSFRNGRDVDVKGALIAQLELLPNGSKARLILHWDGERREELVVSDDSLGWRFYHRARLSVNFVEQGAQVSLKVLTDARGGNGREVVLADRVLVKDVKPYVSRLQIAAHSRANLCTTDLDNLRLESVPAQGSLSEDIDLSPFRQLLQPGTNVLAVLGLNADANDPSFLALPELYGFRTRLQLDSPRFFSPATPLAANSEPGYASVSSGVSISPKGGVLTDPISVQLSTKQAGGVIHYTLDGREPTETSDTYSAPLPVSSSVVLKAAVFTPGLLPSQAAMETYTYANAEVADFNSNLPVLLVNSGGRHYYENRKQPVAARLFEPAQGRTRWNSPTQFESRGDINVRGFSSLQYSKKSYTFRLRDEYGEKAKAPMLGMPKDSDWVLLGPYPDKTLMRDVLAYELSRAMGHYAPRTRFIELFMNQTGDTLTMRDYQGVYVLVEKIKRGKNRVDIHDLGPGDNDEPNITGGYIFKRDHSRKEPATFISSRGGEFFFVDPEADEATPQQREWLERHFRELERSIYGKNFADPQRGYRKYLDVESFIDQHWLIEMSKNIDGFRYSVYFSKDRGGKVKLEPAWDWNLSFGNANYLDGESTRGWYTEQLRDSEISWFRRLVEDPEFNQQQMDRWWALRQTVLQPEVILRRVDEIAAQLQEAQVRNFRRWPVLGRSVHPNAFVGESYAEEVNWMKEWIKDRIAWIDEHTLPKPPTLTTKVEKGETKATLRGRGGRIYFTLDGTDPRQAGGTPSKSARSYDGPVALPQNARLVARIQASDIWSPPVMLAPSAN